MKRAWFLVVALLSVGCVRRVETIRFMRDTECHNSLEAVQLENYLLKAEVSEARGEVEALMVENGRMKSGRKTAKHKAGK